MYELQSRSVLMTRHQHHQKGAGFWPLAGCSASQPLPKMWEAWFIPLMCHVISAQMRPEPPGPGLQTSPDCIRMLVVWIPSWAIGRERPVQLMPRCRHGGYEWHHPPAKKKHLLTLGQCCDVTAELAAAAPSESITTVMLFLTQLHLSS